MQLRKEGFPEAEELLLCSVTGINPHGVFVTLDEYGGKTGMIHISEIAPGRIRNIREYVQEGKKIVCKVLQINRERGHIDLSLRRVNESQRRNKLNSIKQEQVAEKIIEQIAKQKKKDFKKVYSEIAEVVLKDYETIYESFEAIVADELNLEKLIDKEVAKALTELVKQRIKPLEVKIGGNVTLTSFAPDGVVKVKAALNEAVKGGLQVRYLGAGAYHVELTDTEYKSAEKTLKKAIEALMKYAEKNNLVANFERKEIEA